MVSSASYCFRAAALAAVASGIASASAATLTAVPMQGTMVMPMVAYHAGSGRLDVQMPAEIPQLTPLLVSHPGDGFDPADPWFDTLDPTRGGVSFSRRYGFVMDTLSDPLPANTAIWIRKVSGPAELGFFRYSASAPKAWEPVFGTAGSSDALAWNAKMFHPAVTAPPGTNGYTAVFDLFLADTGTGQEVSGSSSGPLVFQWTNVPDGRPSVEIGLRLLVAWSTSATGYVLESADAFAPSVWWTVTNAPVVLDGRTAVVLEAGSAARFYRLRKAD